MKKQLWRSLVLLIVIAVIVAVCAQAAQPTQAPAAQEPATRQTQPSNDTKLLFLGNKNIAPVIYLDGATPSGVAVDIVNALAKHIPQPVEIKAMNWSEAQALVARGEADALIQINPTEERKKIYDFSDTLLESQFSIFTRADRMGISGLLSLHGLRIGVESGGLPQQLLNNDPQIQLIIIPNFLEGFKLLNESTIDAVVVDYRVGSYVLAVNNIRNIKVTGEPIAISYSSFAVKKGNTKLLNEINNALRIIKADGTYQNIIDKWKPKETVFLTEDQITHLIHEVIILILLILFLIVAIWMVTLRKELTRRKRAEMESARVNRTLLMLSNTNQALIHIADEATLLYETCRIAVEVGGYRMAWVGFAEHDQAKTLRPVAHAGFDSGYIESAKVTWADNERGRGPGGTAIRTGQPGIARNIQLDPAFAPWREAAFLHGYKSVIALPLISEGQTLGALGIYSDEIDAFDTKEVEILRELAVDLAFGITTLRTRAKRDQAEESIRFAKEEAERASMVKTNFLHAMSHELRTPLNAILGFSGMLKQRTFGELNEKQEHLIDNVMTGGNNLLNIINQILDIVKMDEGTSELNIEKIFVPSTVEEIIGGINDKAAEKNIIIKKELDPQLKYIEADKQKFKQVFINLLYNAIKFSKPEGGTISITVIKVENMAKFSVSDTGIGIKEKDIENIFQKFTQLDPGMNRKYGGVGIGLAISKQFVERHGGKIWAESKIGEGSTFTFLIPLVAKKTGTDSIIGFSGD